MSFDLNEKDDDKMNIDYQKLARENLTFWIEALNAGKVKKITKLYAKNATFLPTFSSKIIKTSDGIEEYFENFLQKNPSGIIIEEEVQILAPDCYLHSGLYEFDFGTNNNRQKISARFSFIWSGEDWFSWKIIHHHSSVRPKE